MTRKEIAAVERANQVAILDALYEQLGRLQSQGKRIQAQRVIRVTEAMECHLAGLGTVAA